MPKTSRKNTTPLKNTTTRKNIKSNKNYGITRPKRGGKKSVKRRIKNKTIRRKRKNRKMRGGNDEDKCPICLEQFSSEKLPRMLHPKYPVNSAPHSVCEQCLTAAGGENQLPISDERHPLYICPSCRGDHRSFWSHIANPSTLQHYLYLVDYDKIIMDIFNDEQLSKEQKIAKLQQIKNDIIFLKENLEIYVTEADKYEVNKIFEDYIGEQGSINDAIIGLEMEKEHAAREEESKFDETKPAKRGDVLQPKTGSLARRE